VCIRQDRLGSAPPKRTTVPATPWRRGQGSAAPHAPQSQCQCHTRHVVSSARTHRRVRTPMGDVIGRIVHLVGQMSQQHEVPPVRIGNKHDLCVRGHRRPDIPSSQIERRHTFPVYNYIARRYRVECTQFMYYSGTVLCRSQSFVCKHAKACAKPQN